jgi:hypothetical protein
MSLRRSGNVERATLRIDEVQRRPVAVVEGPPDSVLVVHGDRVVDLHPLHGSSDVVDALLEWELRRVDAYHHQPLILVFVVPGADIGSRPQPVDAGIGPEIDKDDLTAQADGVRGGEFSHSSAGVIEASSD